jgi:hypothetical protein
VAAGRELSIVVVPLLGQDALSNCLDRLPLASVECIVVLCRRMGPVSAWQARYPSVIFLLASREPVPLRRLCGIRAARGDVVGLIEDTSWPDADWCAAALSALAGRRTAAAGGSVRIASTLPNRYQALGSSEYGAFAADGPRLPSGNRGRDRPAAASRIPGNNMAFRRLDLLEAMRGDAGGLFEGPVCARLLAAGRCVVYDPRMAVTYAACDRHNAALATRLHHGRIYAAALVRGRAWPWRLGHFAKTPFLPLVLTMRAIRFSRRSSGPRAKLPVLFWLALMETAWSLGEAVGALSGAGRSLEEWR